MTQKVQIKYSQAVSDCFMFLIASLLRTESICTEKKKKNTSTGELNWGGKEKKRSLPGPKSEPTFFSDMRIQGRLF